MPTYFPSFQLQVPPASAVRLAQPSTMIKPIRDIIMASPDPSLVHSTSTKSMLPTGHDPCDLSITSNIASLSIAPNLSSTSPQFPSPPDEVFLPGTSNYLNQQTKSAHTNRSPSNSPLRTSDNWPQGNLTSQKLDNFAETILPTPVQIQLAQSFGKDNANQLFDAEKCFRHIVLLLLKSGF